MKLSYLIVLVALLGCVKSADDGDWVDTFDLPIGFITHPFYAGYLNIAQTQSFYYHYFPSESNPGKDPLIVRISAGPGCSALYSAYYSKGPFIFVKNTKNFRVNPFNWNKQANLLVIQAPAGVGFAEGSQTQYSDDRVALLYYFALLRFYQKFPQLKDQTMYLSGQQYAGITIPRIARTIVNINKDPNTAAWLKIKFGGFLLNNPCTLGDECDSAFEFNRYTIQYLKNHYFISQQTYDTYINYCGIKTPECQQVLKQIQAHFYNTGSDLNNPYTECVQQQGDMRCLDHIGIYNFLNDPDVKKDIHANTNIIWKMCNPDLQKKWVRDPAGSMHIYQQLLRQERGLRIWIVSGQLSASIPITGTKRWFEELKHNLGLSTTRMWQPWYYNHTLAAGDIEQIRGMTFLSVRGSGYHLWNDQPELGYYVLDSFLKGTTL